MATNYWIAGAAIALGLATGYGLGRLGGGGVGEGAELKGVAKEGGSGRRSARGPASPSDSFDRVDPVDRRTSLLDEPDASEEARDGAQPSRGGQGGPGSAGAIAGETQAEELARLRKEVARLESDHREMFGEPIAAPSGDRPERYGGSSISSAVQQALADEQVGGAVETVDCSEHPCIIFGRLEGDEEDMEEIERAPSMSQYDDDVLTLLFWATSIDEGRGAGDGGEDGSGDGGGDAGEAGPGTQPETGLFALSFYSREERAERGEELDRRIRARVMEYWNVERPGRAG